MPPSEGEAEAWTPESFERSDILGNGSFCDVLRCTERASGNQYAMKVVPKRGGPQDQAIVMEDHCLKRLAASPAVVKLFRAFDMSLEWIGVMELCEGGELWAHIKDCGCCLEGEAEWYASQMVEALAAVHDVGIVHRDVKCENFLLTSEGNVKIIDFGTARDTKHPEVEPMLLAPQYQHHVGTPNFMAPEAIHNKANDQKSDLWSLGCSIYQLALGAPPFGAASPFLILSKAQTGQLWLPTAGVGKSLKDLLGQLVQTEPSARLGAAGGRTRSVLDHPFFKDFRPAAAPRASGLALGLRRCARAAVAELAAAEAGEEEAEEHAFGGPTAPPAPKPGTELASLLEELPGLLQSHGGAGPAGEALLGAVREAAAGAKASSASDFASKLAAAGAQRSSELPEAVLAALARLGEASERRRQEASMPAEAEEEEEEEDSEQEAGRRRRCCPF